MLFRKHCCESIKLQDLFQIAFVYHIYILHIFFFTIIKIVGSDQINNNSGQRNLITLIYIRILQKIVENLLLKKPPGKTVDNI